MDWRAYLQMMIGLVTALGMLALIANTIITGRDAPAGIVSIILSGMGAVFGMSFWPLNGRNRDRERNGNGKEDGR